MSSLDRQTYKIFKEIKENGYDQPIERVYAKYEDTGLPAPTRFGNPTTMVFKPGEVPFLESKKAAKKDPFQELSWIYQHKSNDVVFLREELGCNVWNQWEEKENKRWLGTIGPAYGFVVGLRERKYRKDKIHFDKLKPEMMYETFIEDGIEYVYLDQLDYLIQEVINNPYSRYHIISLWIPKLLDEMKLKPCVWTINVKILPNGYMNLIIKIRSNDMALGNPYNMIQYFYFLQMLAQSTGYKPGTMFVNIDDPHYYDRHIELTEKQFEDYDIENEYQSLDPTFWINPEITNFYEFKHTDLVVTTNERIVKGEVWKAPKIKFPLSIS